MISLYEGVPGSGKSLYASGQILEALELGHLVICNFPFSPPAHKRYSRGALVVVSNSELSVAFVKRWADIWLRFRRDGVQREHQILLVVDEAGVVFNPRDWNSPGRKDWLSFFSQHRKFMFDVIFIAQSDAQLDKQIRGCIDVAEKFMDVRKLLPDRGWYCPPIFKRAGKVYGVRGQAGAIGQKLFRVRKRWAQSYNTFELFGVSPLDGFPESVPVVLDLAQQIKPCYRWKRPLNLRYARRGPGRIAG